MAQESWSESIWGWHCDPRNTTTLAFLKKYENDLTNLDQYTIDELKNGGLYPDPDGSDYDGLWPIPWLIRDIAKNKLNIDLDVRESSDGEMFIGICPSIEYPWTPKYSWPKELIGKSEEDITKLIQPFVKDIIPNANEPTYHEIEYYG